MKKEILVKKTSTLTVNVVANQVESLRKMVETTSTIRVYDNGLIGVAGQIGCDNLDELEKKAIENLANGIPYPADFTKDVKRTVDNRKDILNDASFTAVCRDILARLTAAQSDFLLNNKITYIDFEESYSNSDGTQLNCFGNEFAIVLTVKHKATANLIDFVFVNELCKLDIDMIVADYVDMCEAFNRDIDIPDGKYKIVAEPSFFAGNALGHFTGELYHAQASLFKEKLNQRIFSDKLSILLDRSKFTECFFDDEGSIAKDDCAIIVDNGVLKNLLCNKKVAADYSLPRAECSHAAYDAIPAIGISGFGFSTGNQTLDDLIGNDKAIYAAYASGGDMTSSGDFATPIQVAFLVENGKFVGKLPQINATGNICDYLGDDYIGTTDDGFARVGEKQFAVAKMNVTHIK